MSWNASELRDNAKKGLDKFAFLWYNIYEYRAGVKD